jgi:hypothetical protein
MSTLIGLAGAIPNPELQLVAEELKRILLQIMQDLV